MWMYVSVRKTSSSGYFIWLYTFCADKRSRLCSHGPPASTVLTFSALILKPSLNWPSFMWKEDKFALVDIVEIISAVLQSQLELLGLIICQVFPRWSCIKLDSSASFLWSLFGVLQLEWKANLMLICSCCCAGRQLKDRVLPLQSLYFQWILFTNCTVELLCSLLFVCFASCKQDW